MSKTTRIQEIDLMKAISRKVEYKRRGLFIFSTTL